MTTNNLNTSDAESQRKLEPPLETTVCKSDAKVLPKAHGDMNFELLTLKTAWILGGKFSLDFRKKT